MVDNQKQQSDSLVNDELAAPIKIDSIHIPEDAGDYADALEKIMLKIPTGWGRWISCGKGWYPLVVELDQKLEKLVPGYEVNQVKEKFGTLRYYFEIPQQDDPYTQQNPSPNLEDDNAWAKWQVGWQAWADSVEGKAYFRSREELQKEANELVTQAEILSAKTCESCGADGALISNGGWLATLCETCNQKRSKA